MCMINFRLLKQIKEVQQITDFLNFNIAYMCIVLFDCNYTRNQIRTLEYIL